MYTRDESTYKILVRKYERQRFRADIDTIGRIKELGGMKL
jgi:hypothetical protein